MTHPVISRHTRMPNPLDSVALLTIIRQGGRYKSTLTNIMLQDWPVIQSILDAAGRHLGDSWLVEEEGNTVPVANRIIEHAVACYSEAVNQTGTEVAKTPDIQRLARFVGGLIEKACQLVPLKVTEPMTGNKWSLASSVSFPDWFRQTCRQVHGRNCIGCNLEVEMTPPGDCQAQRQAFYELITDERIRKILERGGYEEAMVSCAATAGR